jgi:phenylacetate-CoA ligase
MLAFSFGPFIGFWAAQHAVGRLGALLVPGGGMSSPQRLAAIRQLGVTVLVCTPSYALHLGSEARGQGLDPQRDLPVRITLHAGEPGASVPATRARIEALWGAQCFDHTGASEVGAHGFSCMARSGIHINEAEFIAEIVDPETGEPVAEGGAGELVLTNLGRSAFPVVRYRAGDLVQAAPRGSCACGRSWLLLAGGILGRIDDMVCIRGVNVFPAAFQDIFNGLPGIGEHRITAYRQGELDELHVEYVAEAPDDRRPAIANLIRERLGIRVSLQQRLPGDLPHFELKAQRFFDRRGDGWRPEAG